MAKRFPRSESDIATLAARVIEGLTNAAEDFPTPPVPADQLPDAPKLHRPKGH